MEMDISAGELRKIGLFHHCMFQGQILQPVSALPGGLKDLIQLLAHLRRCSGSHKSSSKLLIYTSQKLRISFSS